MKLEFVCLLFAAFPLAETLYEPLGHLCLNTGSENYKVVQPIINYEAKPYPFVTNTTNITITCVGRSVHQKSRNEYEQSYMKTVAIHKNSSIIKRCKILAVEKVRNLSCTTTETGVTSNDKFDCYIYASRAPCNGARIIFEVQSLNAPTVSPLFPTIKYEGRKLQITCVGTGVPPPTVTWLFNGSMINYTSSGRRLKVHVDTELQIVENGTNTYRVYSRILIIGQKFPLRIQCIVSNEMYYVYSQTVYTLFAEIVSVNFRTATVRWMEHPAVNYNHLNASSYNISLICENKYHDHVTLYDQFNVTFSNLTMEKAYTVNVQTFINISGLAIGAVTFYSPGKLPKPKEIFLEKITSRKAVIRWENFSVNKTVYGVLLGYKFLLTGNNKNVNFTLTTESSEVVLGHLTRKSRYTLTMRGFTKFGDGDILEYNFTTLDVIPAPLNVSISSASILSAVVRWTAIEQRTEAYDKVIGYTVAVRNETYIFHVNTSNDMSSVSLNNLLPYVNYSVSVVGRGDETEGIRSEWISFKTNEIPENILFDGHEESNENGKEKDSTVGNAVLSVSIVVGVIFTVSVIAYVGFRRRKSKKSKNVKPNQMVMQHVTRSSENNLRILYPEYYDENISNHAEELPSWEINRSRLALLDNILGGGCFGLVKEGMLMQTSDLNSKTISVAVKTLKAHHRQCDWNELLREFEILKHVNLTGHRNIIKLIGACSNAVPVLLVMEYCPGGNLKDLLRSSRVNEEHNTEYKNIYCKLTERQLINFAAEIARGMIFLFEKKVVHRDIASRNILLNDQLVPKIADFGLARKIDVTTHYIINKNKLLPVKWMSIESLEQARFTAASDTWSYGVLLWEICTLAEEPYLDVSPYDILEYLLAGNRMSRPEHCSSEIFAWMERCWKENPEERPSFEKIYNSLESMLTDNERTYINVRPYQNVNETTMLKSNDICRESRYGIADSGLGEEDESISRVSGVYDTSFQ